MSLRFRRYIKLAPGIRLNVGLRGPSLSVGPSGAGLTFGPAGLTSHVGIPGTGLSYRRSTSRPSLAHGQVPREALPGDARPLGGDLYSVSVRLSLADDGHLVLSGADGQPLDPRIERKTRELQENQLKGWLHEQCDAINAGIDRILSLHRGTPAPRHEYKFTLVAFAEAPPAEPAPLQLGILDRLFAGRRRRREAAQAAALERHRQDRQRWEAARDAHLVEQERQRRRWQEGRLTSSDVMHELLEEALHAIDWPRETLVNFEIEGEGALLQLDVDLPDVEDIPRRSAEVAARGLKLNFRERSETQVRKLYLSFIHGVLFRVIGEAFATLPTVQTVECSGFSQRADPATGHARNEYLLSVRLTRAQWEEIDFTYLEQVDPVTSLERFELRRDSTASGTLQPITPFEVHDGLRQAGATSTDRSASLPPSGTP
jgi:hypothetical protein